MYAEYHKLALYAECHYAECHYSDCRGAVCTLLVLQTPLAFENDIQLLYWL
jgi:hypothetical protein